MNGSGETPLRVVEISSGIAGAYCGWLLQQMGANVVRIGAVPTGAHDADPIAMAMGYYSAGKQTLSPDGITDAVASADLVITDDLGRVTAT